MRWLRILAVVGAGASLAGCGGGGDRLTMEELSARADEVCARFEKSLDALEEPQSMGEIGPYAEQARPIVEDAVAELRKLEPPDDVAATWDRWMALNDQSIDALSDLAHAAAAGDAARVREVAAEAAAADDRADALAGELGLQDCGND
jgi:hypothetical protein